jgi:hypothetical protein
MVQDGKSARIPYQEAVHSADRPPIVRLQQTRRPPVSPAAGALRYLRVLD